MDFHGMQETGAGHIARGLAVMAVLGLAQGAAAQELLPTEGGLADTTGYLDIDATEDAATVDAGLFTPLWQADGALLMLDAALQYSGVEVGGEASHFGGAVLGFVYRRALDADTTLGANLYADLYWPDAELLGSWSLGVELEQGLSDRAALLAGANYYLPFEDYTDPSAFPDLVLGPRQGLDAFVELSWQATDRATLGLSLGAFTYLETDFTGAWSGGALDLTGRFDLNDSGTARLIAELGRTVDTDGAATDRAALTLEFDLGRRGGGYTTLAELDPSVDCAVVPGVTSALVYDCEETIRAAAAPAGDDKTPRVAPAAPEPAAPVAVRRPTRHVSGGALVVLSDDGGAGVPSLMPTTLVRFDVYRSGRFCTPGRLQSVETGQVFSSPGTYQEFAMPGGTHEYIILDAVCDSGASPRALTVPTEIDGCSFTGYSVSAGSAPDRIVLTLPASTPSGIGFSNSCTVQMD